jgi:hypothetical protein
MEKHLSIYCIVFLLVAGCNSEKNKNNVKEPVAEVAQTLSNDTITTYYNGARPYQQNKQINTQIKFVRSLKDTVGRFYLNEVWLNKKDSVIQHYEGVGNYKILPKPNGEIQGVALYNMVLDDKSQSYLYLLKDSVTMVMADDNGKVVTGESASTLISSNKK